MARTVCNPFYVLGLTPAARASAVTLRFRALQSDLSRGRPLTFTSPLGRLPLSRELLVRAYAQLRDPDERLEHELRYVPVEVTSHALRVVSSEAR